MFSTLSVFFKMDTNETWQYPASVNLWAGVPAASFIWHMVSNRQCDS